jgi:signal transduction histidine kinase
VTRALGQKKIAATIESAVKRVRKIKENGSLRGRIGLTGTDEVSYLTGEFDRLLDARENTHHKVVEIERMRAKIQLAKDVAHNIRSPIMKVECVISQITGLPELGKKMLCEAVEEVKAMAERLHPQPDSLSGASLSAGEEICIREILKKAVEGKRTEFSGRRDITISLDLGSNKDDALVSADPLELRAVISNIINNAVEAYDGGAKTVHLRLIHGDDENAIEVLDQGKGISSETIRDLGQRAVTAGKVGGKGIGLFHAHRKVAEWGGHIAISSRPRFGTSIKISLPRIRLNPAVEKKLGV